MKKTLLIAACCLAQLAVFAQPKPDNRAAHTKVADLLQQQPANNNAALEANMKALAEMGEEGVLGIASMMAAPGKGDNTAAEYALTGYAFYVTQPGKESLKAAAVKSYVKALEKVQDKEVKEFFIRRLEAIGNDDAVPAVAAYLADERLSGIAARTLVQINSAASRKALLDGINKAQGRNKQSLVLAIGDARVPEAATILVPLASSTDKMLAKTALYALSYIAAPTSAPVLEGFAKRAGYKYDETNATTAYLAYIQQLAAAGKKAEAAGLAEKLLATAKDPSQNHVRIAALSLLDELQGDQNQKRLLAAYHENDAYRVAALKLAGKHLNATSIAGWLSVLKTASPGAKADIIEMLGNNKVGAALPVAYRLLGDKDAGVRLAAITAAGQIGGAQAVPALLQLLSKGNSAEVEAVRSALKTIKGNEVATQSAAALSGVPASAQVALLDVLATRQADGAFAQVLPLTKSPNETVRKAAFASLKDVAGSANLATLLQLLNSAGAQDVSGIQDAVIAAAGAGDAATVIASMKSAPADKRGRYFTVLGGIGGASSLAMVKEAAGKGDAAQKQAAVAALSAWKDASAMPALLDIARKDAGARNEALKGYVRLAKAETRAEQRLLYLEDAMQLTKDAGLKKNILQQAEQCKTFPALVFAGQFLDDKDAQQEAAQAVMNIALADKSYSGNIVKSLLEKTSSVLKGGDAGYQREAIRKYLSEMPAGEGFVSLFNGKDLSGWKGLVANPIKRSKMDAATLKKEQEKADAKMREGWSVKDGVLWFNGHGDNLCTDKKYGDFEMFVDWKIEPNGDAGIYLRGTPQVQIWDTTRRDVGAEVGSGGLYNNQKNASKPLKLADNAINEWNNFRIIMKGDRVTVYLNGELVVDNVILENYWDRKLPIFVEEQLELQAHGTNVYYRNLYVREFERPKPFELSADEKKEGYRILFDGTNMHEWTGNTTSYVMEDGAIVCRPGGHGGGNLYTKDEYSDFVYRFEFQLTPGANNGLGIRAPLGGDAAYEGMELQILDNEADIYKNLEVYQYHGSVYGVIPAKRGFLKPVGEWNYEQVTVKGTRITVELNGTVILDGDIANARDNGTLDHKNHPGLKRTTGHIGFLGHGSVVKFRNIRVKDLTAGAPQAETKGKKKKK
ncbi:DUF1080 domain-containing protein [Chitinophaga rhizosphaerae]|uniref:DUF1080 domain-containing protein n=1 Tax=Chitinophaga rhizosphaerae TaxID=1864947 RepID=UPI000F8068E2|nr:DUF1080 domain-containing protein [Chitinophaga rhizosphaerae]